MVLYSDVKIATFINRPNRFIAICQLADELIAVHVKNTGRCKELLLPQVKVALSEQNSPKRKTKYDLIAVMKESQWINIDSQVPNQLAYDGIISGKIELPDLIIPIKNLKREQTYKHSRFDMSIEDKNQKRGFIEVKGMTLENQRIAAFPDAPSLRALKHVQELIDASEQGYYTALIFIIQFLEVDKATIYQQMQPELAKAIKLAMEKGVHVLAYNCLVTANQIVVKKKIPFDLTEKFSI